MFNITNRQKEMYIKTTTRYHLIPIRMATLKNNKKKKKPQEQKIASVE